MIISNKEKKKKKRSPLGVSFCLLCASITLWWLHVIDPSVAFCMIHKRTNENLPSFTPPVSIIPLKFRTFKLIRWYFDLRMINATQPTQSLGFFGPLIWLNLTCRGHWMEDTCKLRDCIARCYIFLIDVACITFVCFNQSVLCTCPYNFLPVEQKITS